MSTAFETEMGVLPEIAKAVDEMEWSLPTDIQSDAIPLILGGGDVLMAAETGSGKTGAFCLPVLQIVYESLKNCNEKKIRTTENVWKMNVYDRTSSMAIDSAGTLCQSRDGKGWHGCRANRAVKGPGRFYFEALVTDDGLCRVGWSTKSASLELGTCPDGFGFGGTGKKSNNKKFDTYGESFANGDAIGNCIDFERGEIRWYKNGVDFGAAYSIPNSMARDAFYPAVCLKNAEMRFNFERTPSSKVPPGHVVLQEAPEENVVLSSCGPQTTKGSAVGTRRTGPLAIILEPSRELAEQTFRQLGLFNKHLRDPQPLVSLIVGGVSTRDQQMELKKGVDIVVATPGRLQDLIDGNMLSLDNCRFYILDECDGLLSQGHKSLIEEVHRKLPKVGPTGDRLQMVVCSATLHSFEVKKLADSLMHFPQWVDLKGEDSVPDTVHHVVCLVDPSSDKSWQNKNDKCNQLTDGVHHSDRLNTSVESPEMMSEAVKIVKMKYVVDVIRKLNIDRSLIFCRTKLDCDNMEKLFVTLGGGPNNQKHQFSCVCLHSDRRPDERKKNLERFKREEVRFMICTDVAARGIDIKGLPYVINVTLPDEKENYVHRIGRVGRAERMGLAISLVSIAKEKVWYHANCNSRGKNCFNTNLVEGGGCCIWYNEKKLLTDIEEHLGVTIDQIGNDFKIQINEFDGKVVYGEKLKRSLAVNRGHVDILAPTVRELAALEKECQANYLNLLFNDIRMLH